LDLRLRGQYVLDSGTKFHSFEVSGNYEYLLSGNWSLFAFASVGRDTKMGLAFTSSEVGGISYDFFNRRMPGTHLQVSAGAGHRNQELMDGSVDRTTNGIAFNNNNFILSYRVRYEDHFLKDAVSLVAALWFQHILYSPNGAEGEGARVMDLSDYRLYAELTVRVTIANLANQAKVTANLSSTYQYIVSTVTASNFDLATTGGVGVQF
jgi:hypothetical protein